MSPKHWAPWDLFLKRGFDALNQILPGSTDRICEDIARELRESPRMRGYAEALLDRYGYYSEPFEVIFGEMAKIREERRR